MGALYGESLDTRSPTFAPLSDDQQILAQWVELILQTPRGSLWTAPEQGIDLRSFVLRGLSDDDIALLPTQIEQAITYDERIARADVTAQKSFAGGGAVVLKFAITITPKGTDALPFTLVGTASATTVEITLRGL